MKRISFVIAFLLFFTGVNSDQTGLSGEEDKRVTGETVEAGEKGEAEEAGEAGEAVGMEEIVEACLECVQDSIVMVLTTLKNNLINYDKICDNIVENNKEIKREIERINDVLQEYVYKGKEEKRIRREEEEIGEAVEIGEAGEAVEIGEAGEAVENVVSSRDSTGRKFGIEVIKK